MSGPRIFTIQSDALAKCPDRRLRVGHFRRDGTCLHVDLGEEVVTFHASFRDDGIREAYDGQKAKIIRRMEPSTDAPDYVIEFDSGNRLEVFDSEINVDD